MGTTIPTQPIQQPTHVATPKVEKQVDPKPEPKEKKELTAPTKKGVKKSLNSEGEIPRFAFTDDVLSTKINLPDLNNLNKPDADIKSDEPVLNIKEKKQLTEDNIYTVWANYVVKMQKDSNISGEMLFRDRELEIDLEAEQIVLLFVNRVQLDNFEDLKTDLLFYLRQNLSNADVTIKAKLKSMKSDAKRLYTDQDKLQYLIEKNPIVKELKDRLGLDVDY